MAIVNTIRHLKKPVDTVNQGYCMSAAAGVHQAATGRRLAYRNSVFVLHGFEPGTDQDDKYVKNFVQMANETYTGIVRGRSALPDDWFPLSNKNRLFNADEALRYKFIDEIIEPGPLEKSTPLAKNFLEAQWRRNLLPALQRALYVPILQRP